MTVLPKLLLSWKVICMIIVEWKCSYYLHNDSNSDKKNYPLGVEYSTLCIYAKFRFTVIVGMLLY